MLTNRRCLESENHWSWKRPLKSSSPNLKPSSLCPLNHVLNCHIYTFLLHLQEWWLQHLPVQPVPIPHPIVTGLIPLRVNRHFITGAFLLFNYSQIVLFKLLPVPLFPLSLSLFYIYWRILPISISPMLSSFTCKYKIVQNIAAVWISFTIFKIKQKCGAFSTVDQQVTVATVKCWLLSNS